MGGFAVHNTAMKIALDNNTFVLTCDAWVLAAACGRVIT